MKEALSQLALNCRRGKAWRLHFSRISFPYPLRERGRREGRGEERHHSNKGGNRKKLERLFFFSFLKEKKISAVSKFYSPLSLAARESRKKNPDV